MSAPPYAHDQVRRYLEEFNQKFPEKFMAGQENHGDNIEQTFELKILEHAKEEVLDQWAYLCALDTLINGLMECLEEQDQELWDAKKRIVELEREIEDSEKEKEQVYVIFSDQPYSLKQLIDMMDEEEYLERDYLNEVSLA